MSSSFRNLADSAARNLLLSSAVSIVIVSAASAATDGYIVPEFEAHAEHHSNLDLTDTNAENSDVYGYGGYAGATLGLRSQRGLTEMKPSVNYTYYPDRDEFNDANYYLDLKSTYEFQRDRLKVISHYSRENAVEGEIAEAQFDTFDPANPDQGANGGIFLQKETITKLQLRPEWVHDLSERWGFGVGGNYQTVTFDADAPSNRKDNDFIQAEAFATLRIDQRTDMRAGAYQSSFETDDGTNKTDATGLQVTLQRSWTPNFSGYVSVNADRSEIETPGATEESDSWGFQVGGFRTTPVSKTDLSMGRSLSPSFGGSRVEFDDFRVQYDRNLSERLVVSSAVRLSRSRSDVDNEDDNDFARADLELRYSLSRTMYVAGGYSYIWQEFVAPDANGNDRKGSDNVIGFRFGYFGLQPQQ